MQFELPLVQSNRSSSRENWLCVGGRQILLQIVPNCRARRYVLRLKQDGVARVTVPRGGSAMEARRFAEKSSVWLERQLLRQALQPRRPQIWLIGTTILFRGEPVLLCPDIKGGAAFVRFGSEAVRVKDPSADLRPEVERHLRLLAGKELPARTAELASLHGIPFQRVSVRNQRSRWGSCSRRGTISLNWRLVQTPASVRDYIVLHELAHVREMNHSSRFWREVARLCPGYEQAERWLKQHSEILL